MTDPVPYTEAEVRSNMAHLNATVPGSRLAATLREYLRVLAEVAALRADAQRWRFVRGRGQLTVTEDGEPILCVWFAEEELPDVLVPLVMSDEGTKNPTDLDDVVDTARSGGA